MIVRPKPHWFRMLFVWHGSVLKDLLPRLGIVVSLSVLAVLHHRGLLGWAPFELSLQPFTMLGIALAIFLGFRNNVCYERYWEARQLWGEALNAARALARQAMTLTDWPADDPRTQRLVHGIAAFTHLLRHHLRGSDGCEQVRDRLPAEWFNAVRCSRYRPMTVLKLLGGDLSAARRRGELSDILLASMDGSLNRLTDVLGGCERILNTPVPLGYSVLLHRMVYFYCALLPFGLAPSTGWFTPVIAAFVAYTFLAGDLIAEELEEPFGTDANDLPLLGLSRSIDDSLRELLGEVLPPESGDASRDYIAL